ncbi:MAG: phosphatase PAP2 family protein [Bacillota bacterium]|nr:phosphatase PAP2 family protein [Bacillota bacterium]
MVWEIQFLQWLQTNVVWDWLTPIMEFCTKMGNAGLIWVAVTVALLIFPSTRKYGLIAALSLVLNLLLCNICLKPMIGRIRPFNVTDVDLLIPTPGDYSFPSGHTSASFAVALPVYFWNKKAGIIAIIFGALIAFSRMYFFVHYPTDILGGLLVGLASAYIAKFIVERYSKKLSGSTSGKA